MFVEWRKIRSPVDTLYRLLGWRVICQFLSSLFPLVWVQSGLNSGKRSVVGLWFLSLPEHNCIASAVEVGYKLFFWFTLRVLILFFLSVRCCFVFLLTICPLIFFPVNLQNVSDTVPGNLHPSQYRRHFGPYFNALNARNPETSGSLLVCFFLLFFIILF